MSAKGLFTRSFTKTEVERMQATVKQLLMEGKTLMSWNDGSTSVSKQFAMPVADVPEECAYALHYFERQAQASSTSDQPSSLSYVAWRLPLPSLSARMNFLQRPSATLPTTICCWPRSFSLHRKTVLSNPRILTPCLPVSPHRKDGHL